MRRVTALRQDEPLNRAGHLPLNRLHLPQGPVLVVFALDQQRGTGNAREKSLEVPGAKLGIQPHVAPSMKRRIHIVVMSCQARPKISALIVGRRPLDARDRDVLDEDVRGLEDERVRLAQVTRAAAMSAIDPPSLCPNSIARSIAAASRMRGSTAASSCMKSIV